MKRRLLTCLFLVIVSVDVTFAQTASQPAAKPNLLVVLCSDRHTQPVVNTGTLHN